MLKGKRIALITKYSEQLKEILQNRSYGQDVTLAIPFAHYNQMEETIKHVVLNKDRFDVALLTCGVNAVILAPQIAELTGKIGLDFGAAARSIIRRG